MCSCTNTLGAVPSAIPSWPNRLPITPLPVEKQNGERTPFLLDINTGLAAIHMSKIPEEGEMSIFMYIIIKE